MQSIKANGKLLISGEYLVLQGALALAVPCKFGQSMQIEEHQNPNLLWQSFTNSGSLWLNEELAIDQLHSKIHAEDSVLVKALKHILKMQPSFVKEIQSKKVTTRLDFPLDWGLGSSSTFLYMLAKWSNTDAIELNKNVTGGSGYDIACASARRPILFRRDDEGAVWDAVNFLPPQTENIFFIYLNKKKKSADAVAQFNADKKQWKAEIETISELTEALLFCDVLDDVIVLLHEHEEVMQYVLQEERIQTALFSDFHGVVKSLGAWGGDFVMATAAGDPKDITAYFRNKGFETIFNYSEMVLFT